MTLTALKDSILEHTSESVDLLGPSIGSTSQVVFLT